MFSELLQTLNHMARLSPEEEKLITASFRVKHLPKGEFFLREGHVCKYVGFLRKGLVRYFVLKNDEESTFEFTKEGEFIADYPSFSKKTKSLQSIEAIEDCEVLTITHEKLQYILENTANGDRLGRLIVEHRFDVMVNQLLSVYMQNSEQRYLKFTEEYGDLSQRIPLYLIASYVGVQAPSLSRIRRRLSR